MKELIILMLINIIATWLSIMAHNEYALGLQIIVTFLLLAWQHESYKNN